MEASRRWGALIEATQVGGGSQQRSPVAVHTMSFGPKNGSFVENDDLEFGYYHAHLYTRSTKCKSSNGRGTGARDGKPLTLATRERSHFRKIRLSNGG